VFEQFQKISRAESDLSDETVVDFLENLSDFLDLTEGLYRTASVSRAHSAKQISAHLATIQKSQKSALSARDRIDSTNLKIAELESSVGTAKKKLELADSKSRKSVEDARKRFEVAEAAYFAELAKSGHTRIVAPFSGTITARNVEVGHLASSKKAIFEMVGVSTKLSRKNKIEIEFGIPENLAKQTQIGDRVEILIDEESVPATISRISDAVDEKSRTISTRATLDEPRNLRHGRDVFVRIFDRENRVFAVPSGSIKKKRNENFVFFRANSPAQNPTEEKNKIFQAKVRILAEDGEFSDVRFLGAMPEGGNFEILRNPSARLFSESTIFNPEEKNSNDEK